MRSRSLARGVLVLATAWGLGAGVLAPGASAGAVGARTAASDSLGAVAGGGLAGEEVDPSEPNSDACVDENKYWHTGELGYISALGFTLAQEVADGDGVLVAVVDSGVDADNPHLSGVVVPGRDLVGDGANPDGTQDTSGHGTAIAGIIAAQHLEESTLIGAAPGVRILPVRVFRDSKPETREAGWGPDSFRVALGIVWAVDQGAKIINVSLSDTDDITELRAAVWYAAENGALVVASAGNYETAVVANGGPRYPAGYPEALGVAAVDSGFHPSDNSIAGPQVDIAAPGQGVVTTAARGYDCIYGDKPSSSYATAYVSAAAALLAERFPDEGPAGWHERLRVSALRDRADLRDDHVGWGVVRPLEALTIVIGPSVPGADSYVTPDPGSLPAPAAVRADPEERTVSLALAVVGGAVVLCALLWILSIARRPAPEVPVEAESRGSASLAKLSVDPPEASSSGASPPDA